MSSATCLNMVGRLRDRDRQREHALDFTVPGDAAELVIRFRYRPDTVGLFRNLLTLSLFDPRGFRGAGHRWQPDQLVTIGRDAATPGFLPGPIPPGHWRLGIDAHEVLNDGAGSGWCEFELSVTASIQTGTPVADVSDPRDRPATGAALPGGRRWYRGDLHSHSVHSDGTNTVGEMGAAAKSIGLDFLAVTCHNTTSHWLEPDWPGDLLRLRGIECTTWFGHANALGTSAWIDWRGRDADHALGTLARQAADQDALLVANHPCAEGNPLCTGCRWDFGPGGFDPVGALEVWNATWAETGTANPDALALWTDLLNAGRRLSGIGGSDSHSVSEMYRPGLGFTWVFADELSEAAVLDGLRRGRVYLSSGPRLVFEASAAAEPTVSVPGEQVASPGPIDLRVRIDELSIPGTLRLVVDGEPRRATGLRSPGGEAQWRVEGGAWFRLELREGEDLDGEMLAMTNPVYRSG